MSYAPFSQVIGQGSVLIEFYRTGCPSCRLMAPAVKDAADRLGVKLLLADAGANQAVGEQLKIDAVPTVIMFTDGEERGRLVGQQPAAVIEEFIKQWQPGTLRPQVVEQAAQ
jgi:thioredoxin 1